MTMIDIRASELEGDRLAWRNLLWDSVRMLQFRRPDLAGRFREAAGDIERRLRATRPVHCPEGVAAQ
jgi:hypothetical protein